MLTTKTDMSLTRFAVIFQGTDPNQPFSFLSVKEVKVKPEKGPAILKKITGFFGLREEKYLNAYQVAYYFNVPTLFSSRERAKEAATLAIKNNPNYGGKYLIVEAVHELVVNPTVSEDKLP